MKRALYFTAVFIMGAAIGIFILRRHPMTPPDKKETKPHTQKSLVTHTKMTKLKGELDIQSAVIAVANKVGKAVVAISTERVQRAVLVGPGSIFRHRPRSPFFDRDPFERFFEDFFGQIPEKEFKLRGLGSGFIIDKKGHILTNYHVVEKADKIKVTLPDGRTFDGRVKGFDPRSDLAIVKIEAEKLPTIEMGDSNLIQVGEWVVALGNPFGHILKSPKPTVTVGVVSALHRQIPTPSGERGYLDMIQTDAAINPGNSGGPLCDLNGKVIGINVAIFSTSGGYQGVGFAIPINVAKSIIDDLIKGKEIVYGWLGVSVQEITPDIAEYFGLPDTRGALISQVMPKSPAEEAGLKEGDIIRAFNRKNINTVHDLLREVGKSKAGEVVSVEILRNGVSRLIYIKVGKRPSRSELSRRKIFRVPKKIKPWRGIHVAPITPDIAEELDLKDTGGVVVIDVEKGSPAYIAGIKKGDVIKEINRIPIYNIDDYVEVTARTKGNVLIKTNRAFLIVKEY